MSLPILLIALTGIISLQLGYTIQKLGVHTIFEKATTSRRNNKHFWYWLLGTVITFIASGFVFYALSEGEISIIQPLTGIGPIILALIVTYYLDEDLRVIEWIAICISTLGVIILSYVSATSPSRQEIVINELDLFLLTSFIMVTVLISAFILIKKKFIKVGIVEGLSAGLIGGLPSLFAKLAIPHLFQFDFFHWSIIMLVLAQFITFILLQHGFHISKAALVASLFTATSILLPVGLAQIFFNESLSILQIIGISLIIVGGVLMSRKQEEIEHKLGEEILPFEVKKLKKDILK
ncbi:MAG: DMT family transporter [Candidatus Thorarchaeota archaeon]